MSKTRSLLEKIAGNLEESMGVRERETAPRLSPVPTGRDVGRRPLRSLGQVDIDLVVPDPEQPRVEFSEDALERLARSIREKGQLSPIRVRWSEALARWVIISGERRWRATKRAGLPTIDCHFAEGEPSKTEILEQQLIENLLREDLQPVEEARAFASLIELNGWTGKQLAEVLRIPASKVTRAMALLKLPDEIQHRIEAGEVSARAGYQISRVADRDMQRELAKRAAAGEITHEDAEDAARTQKGTPGPGGRRSKQSFVAEGGWKVVVSAPRKGTYREMEAALAQVLDEVRHRIANNVQLF